MPDEQPTLTDGTVTLRAWRDDDVAEAVAGHDDEMGLWLGWHPADVTEQTHAAAIARWRQAEALVAEGDREAAAVPASEAVETAERLGAAWLEGEVQSLAARARLRLALTLLTVAPLHGPRRLDRRTAGKAMGLAPLVGLLLALAVGLLVYAARVVDLGPGVSVVLGIMALAVLTLAWMALRQPLADLAGRYGSTFALQGLDPLQALWVLAGALLLGWIGAGLVTGHYLRQTRPTGT